MRESDRRIKEYQAMLPRLREKIASVAMFFVISIVMMTSATFAWYTVSVNPEVKGVQTTISGNGNLEVALAKADGSSPLESAIGDAKKEILLRNLTWGNLINLSDPSYGLSEIELRPAALNTSNLQGSPLYSAKYSADGRVQDLKNDFAYTNYDPETEMFRVPGKTQFGVRAISSVTYTFAGGAKLYAERLQEASSKLTVAQNQYLALTDNDDNMNAICSIMGIFLTDKFGGSNSDYQAHVPQMYEMMKQFDESLQTTGEAILRIANLQQMLTIGSTAVPFTMETLLDATDDELEENGVVFEFKNADNEVIDAFAVYKSDLETYNKHMAKMATLNQQVTENGTPVYWSELKDIVNFLVDINTTEVEGTPVANITTSNAMGMLGKTNNAVIKKGALLNAEQRLGVNMYAENLTIKATLKGITASVKANIYTAAAPEYYLPTAIKNIKSGNSDLAGTDPVAADTFGMAVDVWVRSNAADDYLVLEGRTLTTKVQKTDPQGNKYFTNANGEEVIQTPDGDYYNNTTEEATTGDDLTIVYVDVVVGYEGENRVWDDEVLTEFSTTQGGGSCYTFYADTPQAQAQSLELLEFMSVVFVDEKGKLLAYADMDVDSYYAESGRVTVPLKLRSNSINVGTDDNGDPILAITALEKGVAKRITALIYVDGTKISNTDVLADANIQGQLNIQFGSSSNMEAIKDNEIYYDEVHISASATPTSFDFATTAAEDLKSTVTLEIDGLEPEKVQANFIRQINSTQGTRQETITFSKVSEGTYTADVTFTAPGDYVLRTVWIDGVEYKLETPVTINITGFAIGNIGWSHEGNSATVLSADSYATEEFTIQFAGGAIQPKKVQGVLMNEDNQQLTVTFKKGTTNWTGTARFIASGTYLFEYLIIDGEYYEIPATLRKTIDLSLGMNANIQISKTVLEEFDGTPESLSVYATIKDNKGNYLTALENVSLQYVSQSSSLIENGLYTTLTWNSSDNRYEGNFSVKNAGAYEFAYISIGTSQIDKADAPIITAIPPVPPSYYANLTEESIFAFGADVSMKIALANSVAIANDNIIATMQKIAEDGTVEAEVYVPGTSEAHIGEIEGVDSVTDWLFTVPTTDELQEEFPGVSQIGKWQIVSLDIIGAYDNGRISTAENPYVIDVSEENIVTEINDEMTVYVTGEGMAVASTQFLAAGSVDDGLLVEVRGAGGEVATNVENVQVTYQLDAVNATYSTGTTSAGYSSDNQTDLNAYGVVTVTLVPNPSDKNQFILDADNPMELPFAGTYYVEKVTYNIGNTTYSTKLSSSESGTVIEVPVNIENAPSYTHEWIAPIVKITGIKPEGSFTINDNTDLSPSEGEASNFITNDYECTVNLQAIFITETNTNSCTGETTTTTSLDGYKYSTVTTTISDYNTMTSASMFVQGSQTDETFSYSDSATSSTVEIGDFYKFGIYNRSVLGNGAKGTHITITGTYDNASITYTFKLANPVIINNPH